MIRSVNVGLIRKPGSQVFFEWTIIGYFSFPQEKDCCIESPSFSFCNEMWHFIIYPCGQNTTDSAGWVGIYLKKQYPTSLKQSISFEIGLKALQKKYKSCKGSVTSEGTLCWGTPKLCKHSDLINEKSTVAPCDVLTVFCNLKVSKNLIIEFSQKASFIKEKCIARINRALNFKPVISIDKTMIDGVSTPIGTRLQCITGMTEFENKSLEELRLEDYASGFQKTQSLEVIPPIKEGSGVQSDVTTSSISKSSSITKNRKFKKTTRQTMKYTANDVKQQTNQLSTTAKESISEFKFGSNFEFKPLTRTATDDSIVNEMTKSFKQVTFENTSGQNHDKNAASETGDSGSSFTFGSCTQKSDTRNIEAMNEGEIVHKPEKDFEMIDSDKDKLEGLVKLSEDFKEFYVNGVTDLTLKVQDKEFKVQKFILMARSPVFATMLMDDMVEKKDGFMNITDCDSDIFQEFLLYLYTGEVEKISSSRVTDLYQVADKYGVQVLKSFCAKFMMRNLCLENFCDILSLAVRFKESAIVESATDFFVENVRIIIATTKWLNFQTEYPVEANELHAKALDYILPS